MNLKTQIITFLFSIIFGFILSFLIDIFYKNKLFNIILSFIIVILSSLLYFILLLNLNNAIIHPYYILAILIGLFLEFCLKKTFKKIVLLIKK